MKLTFRNTDAESRGEKGAIVFRDEVLTTRNTKGLSVFVDGDQSGDNVLTRKEVEALIQFLQTSLEWNGVE